MALRHSVIFPKDEQMPTEKREKKLWINQMSYKCPRCAYFIQFLVRDTKRYLKKVWKRYRKKNFRFIPTTDMWSNESEEIKKQLESLGYWAGGFEESEGEEIPQQGG